MISRIIVGDRVDGATIIRLSNAGLNTLSSSGRIPASSPQAASRIGSALSFIIVAVPVFDVSRITVFLKSISSFYVFEHSLSNTY